MFIVTKLLDRKLPEYMLTYTWLDEDLAIGCPAVFSSKNAAMEYVKTEEDREQGVYCMIFEQDVNRPFDVPVVYNGKFDNVD